MQCNLLTYLIQNYNKQYSGLLDLYQKEKEKNKNLELCLKAEERYSEGLNEDIKSLLNIEPNVNFISKSKIKEKIEEIELLKKIDSSAKYTHIELLQFGINQLQELLEE